MSKPDEFGGFWTKVFLWVLLAFMYALHWVKRLFRRRPMRIVPPPTGGGG